MIDLDFVKSMNFVQLQALATRVQEEITLRRQEMGIRPASKFEFLDHEIQFMQQGHPVQAVKSIRDRTGLALDVCRNLVAGWRDNNL